MTLPAGQEAQQAGFRLIPPFAAAFQRLDPTGHGTKATAIRVAVLIGSVPPGKNVSKAAAIVVDELSLHPEVEVAVVHPEEYRLAFSGMPAPDSRARGAAVARGERGSGRHRHARLSRRLFSGHPAGD